MRITTNMMMRNYQNNLTSTLSGLESSRRQVESGRRYDQSYENPLAAARGAVLETRYARNADYLHAVEETQKWQDTQEDILTQLNKMATDVDANFSYKAITGTTGGSGQAAIAASLREMQKSMIYALNTKYGDSYVMAGEDGSNPPFKLEDDGRVTYRGINVNSDNPADIAILDEMMKDKSYVDLGFGLTFDTNGEVVSSSAFDSAYPGIKAVGYGKTADGTSKNLIVLVGQMAEELEKPTLDEEAYKKLWTQFQKGASNQRDQLAAIGTKSQLLETTKDRLKTEEVSITEQYDSVMNIDAAEAITNYSWSQYVYNVALKIGTSIIGPSLLDFMK